MELIRRKGFQGGLLPKKGRCTKDSWQEPRSSQQVSSRYSIARSQFWITHMYTHLSTKHLHRPLSVVTDRDHICNKYRNKRSLRPTMWTSLVAQSVKNLPAMAGDPGWIPGSGIPWRRKWQPTPSILAWKIPHTEEPDGLVHGVARVRNYQVTKNHNHHCVCGSILSLRSTTKDKRLSLRTSLVGQWLRLCTPNAGGLGPIPGWGIRSHMPQLTVSMLQLKDLVCHSNTGCSLIN